MSSVRRLDRPLRVLIVEDSRTQRELLIGILRSSADFVVVGMAGDGRAAVEQTVRLRPDIIVMDIHLPILDGYGATYQIMQRYPTPIVMVSSITGDAGQRSVAALAAGALAVIRKPGSSTMPDHQADREALLTTLRLMAGVRVVTRFPVRTSAIPPLSLTCQSRASAADPLVLAIAASTGGPLAVQTLLCGLGATFPLPILLVQHIANDFTSGLIGWLDSTVPQRVMRAEPAQPLCPGHVYIAPEHYHLVARDRVYIALQPNAVGDRYCPSADLLFESVAQAYSARAIGVVLTGMGDDGTRGMQRLAAAGAPTFAQDEASCVVYGMPRAAIEAGAIGTVASLDMLAELIARSVPAARSRGSA